MPKDYLSLALVVIVIGLVDVVILWHDGLFTVGFVRKCRVWQVIIPHHINGRVVAQVGDGHSTRMLVQELAVLHDGDSLPLVSRLAELLGLLTNLLFEARQDLLRAMTTLIR